MIDQLLTYCDPDTMTAIICISLGAMGAFLYANQLRIESEWRAANEAAFKSVKSLGDLVNIGLKNGEHHATISMVDALSRRISDHTLLIHHLTPKKKKKK